MSGIVLSSSVRQNLLSLQSTADLLAQTQNRLATGNKVNSALDNPTNYFTSQSLNNRASDISNLLDGVSNGVQVLQAANTGITSLQKLIDSAKSVANQALQATSGYSTKSQVVSTTISGATASNLLGTASYSDVAATAGSAVQNNTTGAAYNNSVSGTQVFDDSVPGTFDGSTLGATTTTAATITGASDVSGALNAQFLNGQSFSITAGGSTKTFHFDGSGTPPADTSTDFYLDVSTATATGTDLKNAINTAFGASLTAAVDGTTGKLSLTAGDLTSSITVNPGTTSGLGFVGASVTAAPTTTASNLDATFTGNVDLSGANSLQTAGTDGHTFSITVGSTTKTFEFDNNAAVTSGNVAVNIAAGKTGTDLANTINTAFGSTVASIDGTTGFLKLSSATSTISTTASTGGVAVGLAAGTNAYTTENTLLSGLTSNTAGSISGVTAGDSFTVNGKTVSFVSSGTTSVNALTGGVINSATGTVADFVNAINTITGGSVASVVNGKIHLDATQAPTGINVSLANGTGTPLAAFGLGTGVAVANTGAATSSTGITATSLLSDAGAGITAGPTTSGLHTAIASTDTLTVNGTVINFDGTSGGTTKDNSGYHIDLSVASVGDLLNTIDKITGTFGTANASTVSGGKINLSTGAQNLVISDSSGTSQTVLGKLGLGGLGTVNATTGAETIAANSLNASPVTGATLLSQAAGPTSNGLQTAFTIGDTLSVNGKSITFSSSAATSTDSTGGVINLATGSVQDVLDAIDKVTGTFGTANASTITGGAITLHTGTTSDLTTSGSALAKLGLSASSTTTTRQANSTLSGLELKIASTDGGTASDITFGTGANQVNTLDELNTALAANNLSASLDTTGKLTITTTNDHNAATIGAISGSAVTQAGSPFASATVAGPVADTNSQNTRANLVSQYNNIIAQIQTTAQDSSYNGVNLLNGDQLKLVFNETGKSTLNIQGVTDDPTGLGLSNLASGTDFLDNSSTNKVLDTLNTASSTLRSQASTLGSNLSIVQIRQDFSKNLINVLQTGASSLTLADTNEEAANSQALSTRQSIAVSALALANTSQQSVLRLLQ